MLRKLGLSIAIASALLVSKVNALGLGEIRVKSALNEPLHAEIQLFQVKNLSPLQIKSRMADLNDFALSGLATQRALSDVRFQVRVRPNGTGRIILTSKLPVTEPFMNFLVEVNWPSGRLIREYTLLLDPPSYRAQQNKRNFNADDSSAKVKTVARKPVRKASVKKVPANLKLTKGQYYIRSKDTLWDIAVANRPNKRVTSQQMMVLIQRKNPQAFPNANINVMTANVVIDLPTQAEIDAFGAKEANAEVQRQTKLWKSGNLPKVVVQKPKPATASEKTAEALAKAESDAATAKTQQAAADEAAAQSEKATATKQAVKPEAAMAEGKSTADGKPVTGEKGMLNVLSAEEEAARKELQTKAEALALAAGKDSEKIEKLLKNNAELDVKLALSQESIDRLERDNADLNSKLDTIAKQLEDINRLIMLKDEQLAVLQDEQQLANQQQNMKDQQQSEQSWLDKILADPLAAAAAAGGWLLSILIGLLLLLRRRRKDEPVDEEKSEPSISLPDEVIDDQLQELDEVEDPAGFDDGADLDDLIVTGEVDDLDLDLDLDMDMDLDESLEGTVVPGIDELEGIDEDDLAAELEAQLNTSIDDDDDDLEMLEGIDSLEFDLGESDIPESELDEITDSQEQALAELAASIEDDQAEDAGDELPESLDLESSGMPEIDQEPIDSFKKGDELEIEVSDEQELPDEVVDDTTVEELEVDISEISDTVTSLDELEALEGLNLEIDEDALTEEELTLELDLPEPEAVDERVDEISLEDELLAAAAEGDAEEPEDAKLDASSEGAVNSETEDLAAADASVQLEDEAQELSLDSAVTDIEEEEQQIPMDDALGDVLEVSAADDQGNELELDVDEPKAEVDAEALEEQLDELLNSTDDEIALDSIEPEFDTDNEEDIDLLLGEDGVQMKLDLARAYIEMGDADGAREIIAEVKQDGDQTQQQEAEKLLKSIESE
ncbi:MAG: hypothetical protein MJK10_16815 [Pseudomonadales bacterium]|nr:hypothetical protein [Pseudomonadales bacterium]NRA17796.1 hypothetical protein [Oceanospirillaceae bacterium]